MEVLKTTALLYLQEALQAQKYETCKELLGIARENGATQEEISDLITGFLRGDKPPGRDERILVNNRLRLLKER